jgi:hypothetical protein
VRREFPAGGFLAAGWWPDHGCSTTVNRYNGSNVGAQVQVQPNITPRRSGRNAMPEHPMQAVRGLSMEKWFCWGAMGVGGLLLILFLLNTFTGFPFGKAINLGIDIVVILASGLLIYLGWNAARDVT